MTQDEFLKLADRVRAACDACEEHEEAPGIAYGDQILSTEDIRKLLGIAAHGVALRLMIEGALEAIEEDEAA